MDPDCYIHSQSMSTVITRLDQYLARVNIGQVQRVLGEEDAGGAVATLDQILFPGESASSTWGGGENRRRTCYGCTASRLRS